MAHSMTGLVLANTALPRVSTSKAQLTEMIDHYFFINRTSSRSTAKCKYFEAEVCSRYLTIEVRVAPEYRLCALVDDKTEFAAVEQSQTLFAYVVGLFTR